MAPHSNTLAWKIPWMEEPGRQQSMGLQRVGHDSATSLSLFTFMHWRRKWQPTPVFLPGESQGQRRLVGCRLWGHTESNTTEATQQQQQQQQQSCMQPTGIAPLSMRFSQAGILECVAASFSRGSSWPRDRTHISCGSCTAGGFLMTEPPGKPQEVKGQCIEPSEFSSWLQTYRWFFRPDHRQTRKLSSAGFMGISVPCSL